MKVYGPYRGKDGRWRCVLYKNGKRRTVSYPKMLMERHLGREITHYEDVHHKDGDKDNNAIENLEIVFHKEHCREHSTKYKGCNVTCVYCGQVFTLTAIQERNHLSNKRKGKNSPFCSRRCSGKYGTDIQNEHISRNAFSESP